MRFSGLSPLLVVLVVFMVNDPVNGVIGHLKKAVEHLGDTVNKVCSGVGALAFENVGKGFCIVPCDKEEHAAAKEYCAYMDNANLMKELLCGLVTEEKKEILKILIECFEKKDKKVEKHECHKALYHKLKSYPDACRAMADMAG